MPENWTELDDSTFYLHSDILGTIADYRRNRPTVKRPLWRRILGL